MRQYDRIHYETRKAFIHAGLGPICLLIANTCLILSRYPAFFRGPETTFADLSRK